MIDIVKKVALLGMGLGMASRDKVDEVFSDMVKQGKLSAEEAQRYSDEIIKKSQQEWEGVKDMAQGKVMDAIRAMGLASEEQMKAFNQRVARLESEVDRLNGIVDELNKS